MLISSFGQQPASKQLFAAIRVSKNNVEVKGLAGSARSVAAAALLQQQGGTHLFIMNDSDQAAYFYSDLFHLLQPTTKADEQRVGMPDKVLFFPSSFKRSSKYGREDTSNIVQRTQVLERIEAASGNELLAVVSYLEAIAETVPPKSTLQKNMLQLKTGERIGLNFIREMLNAYNFERSDFVYEPGQYAIRGGIVDIFSFATNRPYRIELFGDEVESIRSFDLNTQLSSEQLSAATIVPNLRTMGGEGVANEPLFQLLPSDSVLWFDNIQTSAVLIDQLLDVKNEKMPELISGSALLQASLDFCRVHFASQGADGKNAATVTFDTVPQPAFNKKFELLTRDLQDKMEERYLILLLAENNKQFERLRSIFSSTSKHEIRFNAVRTSLHEGFIDRASKICCYTDHQIFQRYHRYRIRGEVDKSNAITLQELSSLNVGDYIVHIDHGIGVFGGLVKTDINGRMQEMVRLTYKDNDVIFVSIQGLHRISKYRGKDGSPPKVYKLGTGAWNRIKQAAKKKIKDIAAELIALYARRKATDGFAFSHDSYLQDELEASFIYEDTPDQYKATKALKADMEKPYPMDRLVCGDVGFGKTEVAMRAAFKAVADSKQVAVLVPTTILALQHYKSFKERLSNFPVKVDFISRMKSSKDIKSTLKEVEEGKVDILIGTHRILSKDVKFKDLGLLIVDEEQRFGVGAKEKIRHMRVNVDTLTLTATPIPRTLQFSLMGARDLSVINTPPPNRLPVVTEVHTFSEIIIKDAIDYELQRGGQVFFIHNRIQDIKDMEDLVNRLCPNVRTITAHGQLDGDKLEEIMTDFVDAQYDVLIATTIIESGLDIPNANTIIINQAQNFGLSELHQLRGRVGRSNRKAFCYLLAPPPVALTPEANRRLKAIEEFSDLGSGFNIAMQDLDIRGAGNLLGGEQSGFITEIGFEAYQRILAEAMMELKEEEHLRQDKMDEEAGEPLHARARPVSDQVYITDCHIDTDVEVYFPDEYVSNRTEKLRLYRELDGMADPSGLDEFKLKLIDRFGPMPLQAEELFESIRLRHLAVKLGFEKIKMKNGMLFLYFVFNQQSAYYSTPLFVRIMKTVQGCPNKFKIKEAEGKLRLATTNVRSIQQAVKVLEELEG